MPIMRHAWTKNGEKDLLRGISEMAKVQQNLLHGVNNIDFFNKKALLYKVSNT